MAKFKRVADFEARTIPAKMSAATVGTVSFKPGDLVSYVPSTHVIAAVSTTADIVTALDAGNQVYMLAQSDAVTEKSGTEYKSYKINRNIAMTSAEKLIVGYAVEDATNVEF